MCIYIYLCVCVCVCVCECVCVCVCVCTLYVCVCVCVCLNCVLVLCVCKLGFTLSYHATSSEMFLFLFKELPIRTVNIQGVQNPCVGHACGCVANIISYLFISQISVCI